MPHGSCFLQFSCVWQGGDVEMTDAEPAAASAASGPSTSQPQQMDTSTAGTPHAYQK